MKISETCINVLKNFSTINPSIQVREGNILKTISPQKNIFAKAVLTNENFPQDFAIYELNKFLGSISLFTDPEVEFFDDHLKIKEGKNSIRYVYADPDTVVVPPANKEIVLPSADVEFDMTVEDHARLQKSLSVLRVPNVSVVGDDGTIYLKAVNDKNPSSDSFSIAVGVTDKEFNCIFKAENMKIMNRNYNVKISSKGIAQFETNDDGVNLTYYIAVEKDSTF